jgi:tRNA-2-methylthio-N6-dimethylallyladenosine synthase
VGGCVASQEGAAIVDRAPYVDLVFGPQTLHRLPQMIDRARREHAPQVDISFPEIEKFDHLPPPRVEGPTAFVSVMEGCSKYCSFCVVPYTRGEEVSRPFEDVLREVRALAAQGVREVTLLGQNVNAYRGPLEDGDSADLALLIEAVARIPGIGRIRFITSHPVEFNDRLIGAYAKVPTLANYLHLPVQAGSDRILSAMKRGHTALEYKQKIRRLRAVRPDISLASDFIVGFPGETERDFEDTLALIDELGFDQSFSFIYSRRPGTPAANLPDATTSEEKHRRLERLQAAINASARRISERMVGTVQRVLVEGPSKKNPMPILRPHREPPHRELRRPRPARGPLRGRGDHRGAGQLPARPRPARGRAGRGCGTWAASRPRPRFWASTAPMNAVTAQRDLALEPVDNERLANLCGPFDQHLRQLELRLGVEISSRGNAFRVIGSEYAVGLAVRALEDLYRLTGEETLSAEQVNVWLQQSGIEAQAKRQPEPGDAIAIKVKRGTIRGRGPNQLNYLQQIARHDLNFGVGPAGTGKTYLAVASAVDALAENRVQRLVLTRPGGGGRRAARIPAGRPGPEGRSLSAPAVRRAVGDARLREGPEADRAQRDRDRAARVHARAHAERLVRDPGRGAEHVGRADEDVPDAHRIRIGLRGHGRRDPGRPAAHAAVGAPARGRGAAQRRRDQLHVLHLEGRGAAPAGAAHRGGLRGGLAGIRIARERDPGLSGRAPTARRVYPARMTARHARNAAPQTEVTVLVSYGLASTGLPQAAAFQAWAAAAANGRRKAVEVSIHVVDTVEGQALNLKYRHKDYPTNVLSFPAELPAGVDVPLIGDLVLCAPVVAREAGDQGKTPRAALRAPDGAWRAAPAGLPPRDRGGGAGHGGDRDSSS